MARWLVRCPNADRRFCLRCRVEELLPLVEPPLPDPAIAAANHGGLMLQLFPVSPYIKGVGQSGVMHGSFPLLWASSGVFRQEVTGLSPLFHTIIPSLGLLFQALTA